MSKKKPSPESPQYQARPASSLWQQWAEQKKSELAQRYGPNLPTKVYTQLQINGHTPGKICAACKWLEAKNRRWQCHKTGKTWNGNYPACGLICEETK